MKRDLIVFVAALTVLCLLLALKIAGWSELDRTANRPETPPATGDTSRTTIETEDEEAYLVPVTHITSDLERFDPNTNVEVVVPDEYLDEVEEMVPAKLSGMDSTGAVVEHVSRTPGSVGLVPWDAVDPRTKLLSLEYDDGDYPLRIGDAPAPDPDSMRRIVVGGDIVLDRGLPYAVYQQGYGLDFPMSGGYAAVTSRTPVESEFSEYGVHHEFTAERQGHSGAVRDFLSGADLTLANFENPVLADPTYHARGTVFEGDLTLLPILDQAGIDGVTLANNHVLDAEEEGLYETISHLDAAGLDHVGAGPDLASAREPMIFDLGGTSVGVISSQNVPGNEWTWATETNAGTAPLTEDILREDIRRLKERVDVVIVMPHWGEEYTATPEVGQTELAHVAVEAGADAVVGGHAHWAKGMEIHDGTPVYYGVGNFLFDQVWSEETSTGIFVELTIYNGEVIQSRPVPYIVLDYGQPNFLTPQGGGQRALDKIYGASIGSEFEE